MRNYLALFIVIGFIQIGLSQADTILYTSFDNIDYLQGDPPNGYAGKKLLYGEDSLIYPGTIYSNNLWYWQNGDGDQLGVASHYESTEDVQIFLDSTWGKWHMYPYDDLISIGETNGRHTFDTIKNWGIRSISWFVSPGQAYNILLSKKIFLSDPSISTLSWRSKPLQGPRYQDGYKVYVLPLYDYTPETVDWTQFDPVFVMKEMNSSPPPSDQDSSLFKIQQNQGFTPSVGYTHDNYSLPEPTGSGLVDSSRQVPFMQAFEVSLENIPGGYVQILFLHDSDDDNSILIDDILLKGAVNGPISVEESTSLQMRIFPNPTSGLVQINTNSNLIGGKLQILDLQGRLLKQETITSTQSQIDLSHLSKGVYQVVLSNDENQSAQPLIIK
jgi:hypothetical protein